MAAILSRPQCVNKDLHINGCKKETWIKFDNCSIPMPVYQSMLKSCNFDIKCIWILHQNTPVNCPLDDVNMRLPLLKPETLLIFLSKLSKYNSFHPRKCILKGRLQNGGHFAHAMFDMVSIGSTWDRDWETELSEARKKYCSLSLIKMHGCYKYTIRKFIQLILPIWICYMTRGRQHDDVIKWKHFPRHWPFVRGIHQSPVNSPHKGRWRGALMFFFICAWTNGWVSNRDADDLRRHRAHYDVTVMNATTAITMVADVLVAGVQIGTRLPPCWLTYDLTVLHGLYCAISRSNQFIKECSREVERWAIRLFLCSSSHGDFYALWCNFKSVSIAAEKSMGPLFIKVN